MRNLATTAILLVLANIAAAQDAARFTVVTATETHKAVEFAALGDNRALAFMEAGQRRTAERWIELRRDGQTLPPLLARDFALLTNGDRIALRPGTPALLQEGRLLLRLDKSLAGAGEKPVSIYAPYVAAVFWSTPDGVDDADLFFGKVQRETRKSDLIYLKNGDRIEGSITALAEKTGCTSVNAARTTKTPWTDIAGIAWNTDRQAKLRTKKTHYRATFTGASRINLLDLRFDEKSRRWLAKTQFGPELDLPESALLAADERLGQAAQLSDLTPTRYEHRPYLDVSWPLAIDAAPTGHSLRLGGNTYEKGLGMHASCSATYKLDGQFQRFDAIVGLDPDQSPRGRAKIAIELDGKRTELNAGKELAARAAPLEVHLDVRKARTLTLIVDAGSFGDVQADVLWAKARLIRRD